MMLKNKNKSLSSLSSLSSSSLSLCSSLNLKMEIIIFANDYVLLEKIGYGSFG